MCVKSKKAHLWEQAEGSTNGTGGIGGKGGSLNWGGDVAGGGLMAGALGEGKTGTWAIGGKGGSLAWGGGMTGAGGGLGQEDIGWTGWARRASTTNVSIPKKLNNSLSFCAGPEAMLQLLLEPCWAPLSETWA